MSESSAENVLKRAPRWFHSSLSRKLATFLILSNLIAVVALAASYQRLASLSGDLSYADLIGDQVLLAEMVGNYIDMVGSGQGEDRATLEVLSRRFVAGQRMVRQGGVLRGRKIPAAPRVLIPLIDVVDRRWSRMRPAIQALQGPGPRHDQLRADSTRLTEEAEAVSDKFQDEGHKLRRNMRWLAGAMVVVELIGLLLGLWGVRTVVVEPISDLKSAIRRFQRGDASARAALSTDDDLGELAGAFNDMSEQLSRLNKQMKDIFEQCPSSIFIKDLESRFLYANQHAAERFNLSPEQIVGRTLSDLMSPEAAAVARGVDIRTANSLLPIIEEVDFPFPKGSRRILISKFPLRDSNGIVYAIGGISTDMTDLEKTERELKESEARYRCLFDFSADALMVGEPPSWNFTAANPAAIAMFRARDQAQLLSVGPGELSPQKQPDGRDSKTKAVEMIEVALKNGSHSFEWRHRRLDGEEFSARVLLSRMDKNGKSFLQGSVRDNTELQRAQVELERLNAAIDQSGESILITDNKGNIVFVNPAFEGSTGYSRQEVLGQNPRILKSGKQDEAVYRDLWATIKSGRTWKGRLINKRKDGVLRTDSATISPVRGPDGTIIYYVAIKRDITEQIKLEGDLRQSQKMESIGQLAGGVAHDFNNILTAILGGCEMIGLELQDPRAVAADVDEIRKAGLRASSLTQQLLAFSRRQAANPQVLTPSELAKAMTGMLRRLLIETIELKIDCPPNTGRITADRSQIEQLILNLAVNARDAMPSGGKLIIETSNVEIDPDLAVELHGLRPGPYVMISVSDNGSGMDKETLSHMFEPFYTTKAAGHGTGMGLAVVYGIVKQNGGCITVYSEPGTGTTFKTYFPRVEGALVAQAAPAKPAAGGSETILLVEDEEATRKIASRILRKGGYTIIEASGVGEAAKAVSANGKVHLLITDVILVGHTGIDVVRKIRELSPGLKTLFMSGYTRNVMDSHGLAGLKSRLLQKPFTGEALLSAVRAAIDAPGGGD